MSGQASACPSLDEPRPKVSAQPELASRSSADLAELQTTLDTSSGILSDIGSERLLPALVEGSAQGRAARAAPVGILLYLTSVAIIAAATIGIFFGIGFFLLTQSTAAIITSDAPAERELANNRRPRYLMDNASPMSDDVASVPIQQELPRLAASAALPAAPPAPPLTPSGTATAIPAQDHSVVEASPGSSPPHPSPAPAPAPDAPAVETPRGPSASAPAAPVIEKPLGSSVSTARPAPAGLSAGQITELLTRGDTLLHAGDVASARLFYERAADAGDREAAMRMGATFDPAFLSRVGLHARGDPAKALSWYRHALDLATSKTDRQSQSPQTK
jgi:hypothetical protein